MGSPERAPRGSGNQARSWNRLSPRSQPLAGLQNLAKQPAGVNELAPGVMPGGQGLTVPLQHWDSVVCQLAVVNEPEPTQVVRQVPKEEEIRAPRAVARAVRERRATRPEVRSRVFMELLSGPDDRE